MGNRRAGVVFVKVDGTQYDAKGNFDYNLGKPKREGMVGADGVHGFKETQQIPFIEGEITDQSDLDLGGLMDVEDASVTLELANGKAILLSKAWYAGDGNVGTEEGNVQFRFEGKRAEEVRS